MTTENLFANLTSTAEASSDTDKEANKGKATVADVADVKSQDTPAPVVAADPSTSPAAAVAGSVDSDDEVDPETQLPDELDLLKKRAKMMGITFSNNIGLDALKAKVAEKLNPTPETVVSDEDDEKSKETTNASVAPENDPELEVAVAKDAAEAKPAKKKTLRQHLMDENMKLVRLRITNLDPKDKDLPGQIFTVANEYIGIVKKWVPFGEVGENGWHVPYCIYKFMLSQKFAQIRTVKRNGRETHETKIVRKFALEILPPLTPEQLSRLAAAQLGSGAID